MTPMAAQQFSGTSPDVVVIGGGPGGSTVAALLAEKGHDVVLFEKAHHPRFHIGESLLPMNMPLFDRLGVRDRGRAHRHHQYGAEFVSPWHEHTSRFSTSPRRWTNPSPMPCRYGVPSSTNS